LKELSKEIFKEAINQNKPKQKLNFQ